jgi:D-glycero-D-manno-heptose 1,7-bisphosphate phosphatase
VPRLLIVDRDGVINKESPRFIKHPDEWVALPGSLPALGAATRAGFRIFVVSNQSGLARKLFTIEALHHIHQKLRQELAHFGGVIDAFFFCPHGPDDGCACRKPRPGLLQAVVARSGLPLESAVMIGDRETDLQAARAASIAPMLVLTGHGAKTAALLGAPAPCPIYADLAAAVAALGAES